MEVDCSRVTHPFATAFKSGCPSIKTVRLACLNHAASVHSEPGSNSPKRVMNLVIHELLTSMPTEAGTIFELLIGGPNQSHKINFKEPSFLGKGTIMNFPPPSSTHFPGKLEKMSGKERVFPFELDRTVRRFESAGYARRMAEDGTPWRRYKFFC